MTDRLLELPDALRAYDLEPVLVAGWETRGLAFDSPPIITLRHWTAGPRTGVAPSLRICTIGRPDLPGPLCQVLQERTGGTGFDRVYVIASGRANHGGVGSWAGVTSANRRGTGNEIEWSGPAEAFPGNRKETSERIAAALLSIGGDARGQNACEHREYAHPLGRKVDTNLNGPEFRLRVQQLLSKPEPAPVPPAERPKDDDMPWIMQCSGKPTRLMAGPVAAPISKDTKLSAMASGAPVIVVLPNEYDSAVAQVVRALD